MRKALVYRNGELAGSLTEESRSNYFFAYDSDYFKDGEKPAISLTLPKTQLEYRSRFLFPFFYNLLSEGVNKQLQCRHLKIDENDSFGLLLATAQHDTVGAITVRPVNNDDE